MFVVTLKKAGLKKVGVGVICCALVVFSAVLGRYISGRSVMAAAAASGNKIESAQDIQTWFTGYGPSIFPRSCPCSGSGPCRSAAPPR